MKEKILSLEQYAEKDNISIRRAQQLCLQGKIVGAFKKGKRWFVRTVQLPLPSGSTSFEYARENFLYIDKTNLISNLIASGPGLYFFARPRRFGKSINMDMLRCFFGIGAQESLFGGLSVTKDNNAMAELGKYPVISISFKDLKVSSKRAFLEAFSTLLAQVIESYPEVLSSAKVGESTKETLNRLLNGKASESDLRIGLERLCAALASHYDKKVVVLIDEYDTPLLYPANSKEKKEIASIFKAVSSILLKDNNNLAYGVLTGITKVGGESIFSDLNNLECHDVLSPSFQDCFGFTDKEIDFILDYYGRTNEKEELQKWYDGYQIGGEAIYNPWSICQWMRKGYVYDSYWAETSDSSSLVQAIPGLLNIEPETLTKLLNGEQIERQANTKYFIDQDSMESTYGSLLSSGYLTCLKSAPLGNAQYDCLLAIPNHEIGLVFSLLAKGIAKVKPSISELIYRSIVSKDYDKLLSAVEQYLYESISYFDTGKEDFYHGFTLGLASALTGIYKIKSNRESGLGRFDICLYPQSANQIPIIIEIKTSEIDKLEEASKKALEQIERLDYAASLREEGFSFYIALGIAFSGKKVTIKRENKIIGPSA